MTADFTLQNEDRYATSPDGGPPAHRPRVAVFGGSFDPVHNGHLFMAGEVVRRGLAEEVLFVPAHTPPHKQGVRLSAAEHRMEMLRRAVEPYDDFSISDIEIARAENTSYTVETLGILARIFPDCDLSFIVGSDSLAELHTWKHAPELVNRFEFIVFSRPGAHTPAFAELSAHFGARNARRLVNAQLDAPALPISATRIRALTAHATTLAGLVPPVVESYITAYALYAQHSIADEHEQSERTA